MADGDDRTPDDRTGRDPATLHHAVLDHLGFTHAADLQVGDPDRLVPRGLSCGSQLLGTPVDRDYAEQDVKRVPPVSPRSPARTALLIEFATK